VKLLDFLEAFKRYAREGHSGFAVGPVEIGNIGRFFICEGALQLGHKFDIQSVRVG
jgi:hypothetical protein